MLFHMISQESKFVHRNLCPQKNPRLFMLQYSLSQILIKIKIATTLIYSQNNVNINNIKMLHYDRIDISEEIDVSKTSEPQECDLSQLFFSDKRFKF